MMEPLTHSDEALLIELRTNLQQRPALWHPLIARLLAEEAHRRDVEEWMLLGEESLMKVWDNPKDARYDKL